MSPKPETYSKARDAGLARYFTSKPCSRGHLAERSIANRMCIICARAARAQYRITHKMDSAFQAKELADRGRRKREYLVNIERERASRRRWRETNVERKKRTDAEWQRNHPDRVSTRNSRWWKANPEKAAAFRAKRRARILGAEGTYSKADIRSLFEKQNGLCACGCRNSIAIHFDVDHVIPLSRGGSNWPTNLQLLTPRCNRSKCDKTMAEWLALKVAA